MRVGPGVELLAVEGDAPAAEGDFGERRTNLGIEAVAVDAEVGWRVALAGSSEGAPVGLNPAARKLLDQLKDCTPMALPQGLQADLRPYQVRGDEWLARNARLGLGSVIADDMGLGKTLQVALYESVVREGLASIAGTSDTFQRQGLVLQMILALKQVCNHPAQYLKQGGDEPLASGKVERLFDLLDEIEAAREKVLVFTQFREMGALLQRWLHERQSQRQGPGLGHAPQFLHGGVPRARRDRLVERFQSEPGERVFLLSLKAGGTGLNLTAANHVVHFDLWWNPAVEAQATDRAYRIGQQRNVQVHRFITRGTFEERIDAMIRSKRELAEMTVGTGETWIGQLPEHELRQLFELGELRAKA